MKSFHLFRKSVLFFLIFVLIFTGIASFMFINSNEDFVAKVGKSKIYSKEYMNMYNEDVRYIQYLLNHTLSEEQIRDLNIKYSALNKLIEQKVISNYTASLKLKTSENVIKDYVKNFKYFQDTNGNFDKTKFNEILSNSGITENKYVEELEKAFPIIILMNCLFGDPGSPYPYTQYNDNLIKEIYKHRYQSRIVDIVKISQKAVNNIPKFTENELKEEYEKNKNDFLSAEYRSIEYLTITPEDFENHISISEEEVNSKVEDSELENQRDIINLVFTTEKEAAEAESALKSGMTIEEVASKFLHIDISNATLKNITKGMLPENIISEVFSLKEGEYSKILHSMFGWHIIKVKSIHTILPEDLQEVKSRIKSIISKQKASEEVSKIVQIMNDQIDSGITMQEVAKANNLKVKTIDEVDINGKNRLNLKVENIPEFDNFLTSAFSQPLNRQEHFISDNKGGFFSIYVKIIEPSRIKNFEESKETIVQALSKQYIEKSLHEIAQDIVLKLKKNNKIDETEGISVNMQQMVFRQQAVSTENPGQNYPTSLVNEIFSLKVGEITNPVKNEKGLMIAILKKVNPFDNKSISNLNLKSLEAELTSNMTESLKENFIKYLIKKQPIEINKTFLNNIK